MIEPAEAAAPTAPMAAVESADARQAPAVAVDRYPVRRARPVSEEPDRADRDSPLRNQYVPIVLLAVGLGLRIGQLLFANEGRGNRWAGNLATPGGVGKAAALVGFEMVLAIAIMGLGAVAAALLLNVDFGPVARAGVKLAAAAVFTTGVASWIALFDQNSYSVGGLVLALHIVVILNWILIGYFFALELQELLLTVAVVTALHGVAILGLWRG